MPKPSTLYHLILLKSFINVNHSIKKVMKSKRIEIIAIGRSKIYSVGAIVISPKGDIYHAFKRSRDDFHLSRHSSGEIHWKSVKSNISWKIRKGVPIKEFKGFESLGITSFGLDSLPKLYEEYKMKKCNGIFCIDMREYDANTFNMHVAILTKEGIPSLMTISEQLKNRQIYFLPDFFPMVAIFVGEAKASMTNQ
jgi:hypothetical protein